MHRTIFWKPGRRPRKVPTPAADGVVIALEYGEFLIGAIGQRRIFGTVLGMIRDGFDRLVDRRPRCASGQIRARAG
jgi:hypothetical protein